MAAIKPHCARLLALTFVIISGAAVAAPLVDSPVVWYDNDRAPIVEPVEREPSIFWDYIDDSVFHPFGRMTDPNRILRRAASPFGIDHVGPAHNVNRLDEVPNSSWFTNRIGLFPMTPLAAALGPGTGNGPDRVEPWTVISAKTEGVTPGFIIRDAQGDVYLIKFDPPGFLGMTTCAGVISGRILHAVGYNVPDDAVVIFDRDDLRLGDGAKIKVEGVKRPMVDADIDAIFERVESLPDGRIHAISSKFVEGKPIGPFDYLGRRDDDPNDRIPHEKRRELRGLRVFAAWLNHFDTKQHNSLDSFVTEGDDEQGYVKHHLIDFASSLGSGANGPTPRYGSEYTVDFGAILKRALALGLYEDPWRRIERPEGLAEVGFLESEEFEPLAFDPLQPNSAFADMTDRDGYWAAKIISAFTDEHLIAICEQAGYRDPESARYIAMMLGERRDKIAAEFFERVPSLDFFTWDGESLKYSDLGVDRSIHASGSSSYRIRLASVDAKRRRGAHSPWQELAGRQVTPENSPLLSQGLSADANAHPFLEFECQVNRGEGWSRSVHVVVARSSGRVVELRR